MKILYINSNRYDYLQDIVYSGLVKVLGAENVHPVPFNKSYYFDIKSYPKNLGYHKGDLLQYLKNTLSSFKYDCVIIGSTKRAPFEYYQKIAPHISDTIPVVFIDGGDVAEIGGDLTRIGFPELYQKASNVRPFDLVFKREMLKNTEYASNVYPCPFAFNMDRIKEVKSVSEKLYDVSFWASETHEDRKKAFDLLKGKYDCDSNGTSKGLSMKTYKRRGNHYFEELKRCKITLNIRGNGWDTLRFWEVPALNTFMLSQKLDIVLPNDFTEGENIAYFEGDFSNFNDKIEYYLEHDSERERIANASYKHLLNYHTDIARAEYLIKTIKKL